MPSQPQEYEPGGLGHSDELDKLVPTLVARHLMQGARIGRCHRPLLPPLHILAFAMGTYARLGSAAQVASAKEEVAE